MLKRRLLPCLFLMFLFNEVKAQWVTIPDTNFVNWLNSNGYSSCMNGTLMDTTCNNVTSAISVNCGNAMITNLDGIQYFDSLQILTCSNFNGLPVSKMLQNIPAFPPQLIYFLSSENSLSTIPDIPVTVTEISIHMSSLDSLPPLPPGLTSLFCGRNQLTSLPSLPASLTELFCFSNNLISLPQLPPGLVRLNCSNNYLDSLPVLPISLDILECGSNEDMALPLLPDSLDIFDCRNNDWTSLPVLPDSLESLQCYFNLLTSLTLPPDLETLDMGYNPIINFPVLPASLKSLSIDSINLSAFPTNLPPGLVTLSCSNNPLTSLPVLPPSLYILYCNYTPVIQLPDLNPDMGRLEIKYCPNLTCIPPFQNIDYFRWTGTLLQCLPNAGTIGSAIPSLTGLPICFPLSGCEFNWSVYGKIFHDTLSNCVIDSTEDLMQNLRVNLRSGGNIIQSFIFNTGGYYSFKTGYGNYIIEVDTTGIPFDVVCPSSGIQNASVTAVDSTVEDLHFGIVCKPGYYDLEAKYTVPYHQLIPGHDVRFAVRAGDASLFYNVFCSTGISGAVTATITGPATFVSSYPGAIPPTSVIGNTITWNIPDFTQVDPYNDFNIILHIDTTAQLLDQICIDVSISPFNDSNPLNNVTYHCFTVSSSLDPNAKAVYPAGNIDTTSQWLYYTVFFQNTGTAPAEYIYIIDTLDQHLNASTFQYLSSSHDPIVQFTNNGIIRFSFPDINLPDSTSNEPESHGFVSYRVKTIPGLPLGTQINNTAHIFFDYNPAVVTNTTINTVTLSTLLTDPVASSITLYPNPVSSQLTLMIKGVNSSNNIIEIYDIVGHRIEEIPISNVSGNFINHMIDVSSFSSGTYFIKIPGSSIPVSKFVKF